jgi:hypothetical protein
MTILNRRQLIVSLVTTGIFLVTFPVHICSQEYKYELGGAAGSSFYMGDANQTRLYLSPGIAGGILFRYNFSFHWAGKVNLLAGTVSGNTEDSGQLFPLEQQATFHRTFAELGTQLEFNFFPYSDKYAYIGTRSYTPYLFAGAGITGARGERDFLRLHMPLGVGFKYKLKNRMNIGIEFSMRKLFRDDFDVTREEPGWSLNHPYGIGSSLLKNQDWYSITMIYLTWEFGMREDPCHGN